MQDHFENLYFLSVVLMGHCTMQGLYSRSLWYAYTNLTKKISKKIIKTFGSKIHRSVSTYFKFFLKIFWGKKDGFC